MASRRLKTPRITKDSSASIRASLQSAKVSNCFLRLLHSLTLVSSWSCSSLQQPEIRCTFSSLKLNSGVDIEISVPHRWKRSSSPNSFRSPCRSKSIPWRIAKPVPRCCRKRPGASQHSRVDFVCGRVYISICHSDAGKTVSAAFTSFTS